MINSNINNHSLVISGLTINNSGNYKCTKCNINVNYLESSIWDEYVYWNCKNNVVDTKLTCEEIIIKNIIE